MLDRCGNVPNMGDQDSAILVDFGLSNMENFTSILNTGAILFERPEWSTGKADLKTRLLTNKITQKNTKTDNNTPEKFIEKNVPTPVLEKTSGGKKKTIHHPASGLSVIRDEVNGKEVVFTGNAMPLGMAPLYAHGHLDALSFTLSVDGFEIFVDPGTYLYQNAEPWRRYFRSTAAHNTTRINQMDLSPQIGDFMFANPYHIMEHTLEQKNDRVIWSCAHDAYARLKLHAYLRRRVLWDPSKQTFTIEDRVHSSEEILMEKFFHFHPDCLVKQQDREIVIRRGGVVMKIALDRGENVKIFKGSKEPVAGWYSRDFNQLKECPTLRFSFSSKGEIMHATILKIIDDESA